MRIGLDGTPLLGTRTGIGRYVAELVRHLPEELSSGDELVTTAFTLRGSRGLPSQLPVGVSAHSVPFPARVLQEVWARSEGLPVGLLSGRVDVFHGTNFVLPPPGRAAGVVTVHDLTYHRFPELVSSASRRYAELVPRSLRRARIVCVPSRAVAGEVADTYPGTAERIRITPLGVAPSWFRARPVPPDRLAALGLRTPYLVFVGAVEPRKDLRTVIAAYRLLTDRGLRELPQLALVGPAGWGAGLDLAGLPDGLVVPLGRRPDDELQSLVAGAAALLYPSRYEGFGLPLLEAFAAGTRVVASDIPTTTELLAGAGDLAALFPVGDAGALADLIAAPAEDAPDASGRRRQHVAGYTWQRTAGSTLTAYRDAAG